MFLDFLVMFFNNSGGRIFSGKSQGGSSSDVD